MSFPEYSEKVYGWFVYTVFIIFTAPVAKRIILARMQGVFRIPRSPKCQGLTPCVVGVYCMRT
eukprot:5932353-Amphidinium_carterae.1